MSVVLEKCPICDSERIKIRWNVPDAQNNSWRYYECSDCGDIFLNPPLDPSDIGKYYGDEYYGPEHQRFGGAAEGAVLLFRRAPARRMMRIIPKGGSVLDVGCGRGVFLDILARNGYQCIGTERSATAGQDASKRVKVLVGDLEELKLPESSFDLVTFWQVIEHLADPKATVFEASRILKSGGRMLVQVPNPHSFQARFSGPYWFHIDPPRHMHMMPPRCIDEIADDAGLVREKVTTLNIEYSPFGILQSFYNVMGMRRDLLYDMMMATDKKDIAPSSVRTALISASCIAAPIAALLTLAEWAAGAGGIIEAVYRKAGGRRPQTVGDK